MRRTLIGTAVVASLAGLLWTIHAEERHLADLHERGRKIQSSEHYDQLTRAEKEGVDLLVLLARCDEFVRNHAGSAHEADVRHRREGYVRRIEEREIDV